MGRSFSDAARGDLLGWARECEWVEIQSSEMGQSCRTGPVVPPATRVYIQYVREAGDVRSIALPPTTGEVSEGDEEDR